jgi:hypothetical protein
MLKVKSHVAKIMAAEQQKRNIVIIGKDIEVYLKRKEFD